MENLRSDLKMSRFQPDILAVRKTPRTQCPSAADGQLAGQPPRSRGGVAARLHEFVLHLVLLGASPLLGIGALLGAYHLHAAGGSARGIGWLIGVLGLMWVATGCLVIGRFCRLTLRSQAPATPGRA
jgi:hypothetical protein